jgi:hypothetical protein
MLTRDCLQELHTSWLPNITDAGLDRLVELLDRASPLLIHGCFTRAIPMGCLASHVGWNHPQTCELTQDAGIMWLHRVAHLNPATSHVLREWDRCGHADLNIRQALLEVFRQEQRRRQEATTEAVAGDLVECS